MNERTVTLNGVQVNEAQLREALERIEREKREDRTKPFMGDGYVNIPISLVTKAQRYLERHCSNPSKGFITLDSSGHVTWNGPNTYYAGPFLGFKESK